MGFLYRMFRRIFNFAVIFLAVVFIPSLPPTTDFDFKEFHVAPSRELTGALELNNHLDNGARLLEGRVYGPEAIISKVPGEFFTSIHGGEVIKITNDHITHVAKFGEPCEAIYEEEICGRPLGMAFDTIGNNLIVADAYYGIWLVDLKSGDKKLLVSPNQILEGKKLNRKAKLFNSVAVDKKGDIYWTDSSSDFTIQDGFYTFLANPSGRLFFYDRKRNESKVLLDELYFANGVALSPNEDFIVVSETAASRLMKYHIQGPKKGQSEVFIDGLPGTPDNLTPESDGLWIPLITSRDADHPAIHQSFVRFPLIRKFIARFFRLIETPFRLVNDVFPNSYTKRILRFSGHFESGIGLMPKRTTIIRADWNGNILGSLHGFDKSVRFVSHVCKLDDDHLLLGSPFNRYIGKVKLPRGPQVKIRNVRYEGMETVPTKEVPTTKKPEATTTTTPKPTTTTTTTTPKPTTTTPKPTTTTTTTPKPTTTAAPKPTAKPVVAPKKEEKLPPPPTPTKSTTTADSKEAKPTPKPAPPVKEEVKKDSKPPQPEKLKVIKKGGVHGEL